MAWVATRGFRKSAPPPAAVSSTDTAIPGDEVRSEVLERFGSARAPKEPDAQVRLYRVKPPACPYEELGVVRVSVPGSGSDAEVRRTLRASIETATRALGGDAIGGLQEFETVDVRSGVGMVALGFSRACWTGVVLRFESPDCAE